MNYINLGIVILTSIIIFLYRKITILCVQIAKLCTTITKKDETINILSKRIEVIENHIKTSKDKMYSKFIKINDLTINTNKKIFIWTIYSDYSYITDPYVFKQYKSMLTINGIFHCCELIKGIQEIRIRDELIYGSKFDTKTPVIIKYEEKNPNCEDIIKFNNIKVLIFIGDKWFRFINFDQLLNSMCEDIRFLDVQTDLNQDDFIIILKSLSKLKRLTILNREQLGLNYSFTEDMPLLKKIIIDKFDVGLGIRKGIKITRL